MKKVLTIAGSDSCGGAGIQGDLKTMCALGVYGMSVITAVTAQNSVAVYEVSEISADMVARQIQVIFEDIEVDAVKIGMVSNADIIRVIRDSLIKYNAKNIVVDTVMVSKSGYNLLKPEAVDELKKLISIATIVTPNIPEAEILSGIKVESEQDMNCAAEKICELGIGNVLVKGGHSCGDANDVLLSDGEFIVIKGQRLLNSNTHGTGCTLSSAIASYIARGLSVEDAVKEAKTYITCAIRNSFAIGKGVGPLGHFGELYKKAGI